MIDRYPREHWIRLKSEVATLLRDVPFYAERSSPPPPVSDEVEAIDAWIASLPTITKRDLRRGFPKSLVRSGVNLRDEMARGEVEIIATSGTTDDRLQVLWDQRWWDRQERDGMRLNPVIDAAMSSDYREVVLTTPVCGATCHVGDLSREERTIDNLLFLNQVADPTHWNAAELDRMIDEWVEYRPVGVEADPAYLAALARHAATRGVRLGASFITLTYELATRGYRRAIRRQIDAPLFDLYGATEAGVLFMECTHGRMHHNAAHSHVELLPLGGGIARVVVTTLGRPWMPLLRYEIGDAVRLLDEDSPCGCGRPGLQIQRVEGRMGDVIETVARPVSAATLDDAIDAVAPDLERWQLELSASDATLHFVGPGHSGAAAAEAIAPLLERPVRSLAAPIAPAGSGKYRLVKRA